MSILWLETFTNNLYSESVLTIDSLNTIIYLNMIVIFVFLLYYVVYKMDVYMQKAPSKHYINIRLPYNFEDA